jgi:dipeptidyl-peptidase-4
MADDNVLFENSLRLVEALQAKSIPFELMVYPGRAHGLRGPSTRLHLYRTIFSFFEQRLGPVRGMQ